MRALCPKKGLGGAEPELATKEGTRQNSANSKATASRREPRCETGASDAWAR